MPVLEDSDSSGAFLLVGLIVGLVLGASVFALLYNGLGASFTIATQTVPKPIIKPPEARSVATATPPSPPAPAAVSTPAPTVPPPTVTAPPSRLRVASGGRGLSLQAQPRPRAKVLVVLIDGSVVVDAGETRDSGGQKWRRISTLDGQTGWAPAAFLRPVP